ncbi:MAG: glycosyltransferase family 4 protein [Candidatus Lambdaproteobacteria bacterium]|nr:glycosyltransferase family 4 protein [Candidatus Lambdaproteobacteria bacterium]
MIPTVLVLAFAVSLVATWTLSAQGRRALPLDHPGARSLHRRPTATAGGLAILFGAGVAVGSAWDVIAPVGELAYVGCAVVLLAAVSVLDDWHGVPVGLRLPVHVAAAALLVPAGLASAVTAGEAVALFAPGWLTLMAEIVLVVWMTNLFNFMDGMDGFAGGMAAIGFGAMALAAAQAAYAPLVAVAGALAAANLGFLPFNFPPARIFMGDCGSIPLGFLAAALGLWGSRAGAFPLWLPVLVFSPFIVDATVTLLARLSRGERVWEAHRAHYYQRLVLAGWGHRRTVLLEYTLMLAAAGSGLWLYRQPAAVQLAGILSWLFAYVGLALGAERFLRRQGGRR